MSARIVAVPCLRDNYAYLVLDDVRRAAAVVDPSEAAPVLAALVHQGATLEAILCTHHHLDHVGGVAELAARFPRARVVGSSWDVRLGRLPGPAEGLGDGAALRVAGARARVLSVPGHTLGAVAYQLVDDDALFTGDTLFGAGCGRLFEGSAAELYGSLRRLAALPPPTRIFFGHEYTRRNLEFAARALPGDAAIAARLGAIDDFGPVTTPSTLALELATNPFLRATDLAHFAQLRADKDRA